QRRAAIARGIEQGIEQRRLRRVTDRAHRRAGGASAFDGDESGDRQSDASGTEGATERTYGGRHGNPSLFVAADRARLPALVAILAAPRRCSPSIICKQNGKSVTSRPRRRHERPASEPRMA